MDDLPNSPNFPAAKHSRYTVINYSTLMSFLAKSPIDKFLELENQTFHFKHLEIKSMFEILYCIVGMFGRVNVWQIAKLKVLGEKGWRMDRFQP